MVTAAPFLGRSIAASDRRAGARALASPDVAECFPGSEAVWPLVLGDSGFGSEREKGLSLGMFARVISARGTAEDRGANACVEQRLT